MLQTELQDIIVELFRRPAFRKLSYFQGLHDIISVFYLTFLDYPWEQGDAHEDRSQAAANQEQSPIPLEGSSHDLPAQATESRGRSTAPVKNDLVGGAAVPPPTNGTRSRSVSIKLSQHPGQITFLSVPSSSSSSTDVSRSSSTSASSSTKASRSSSRSPAHSRSASQSHAHSRHGSISREPYARQYSESHAKHRGELLDVLERVCLLRIRDALAPSLAPTVAHLRLLRRILRAEDPAFARLIARTSPATPPFFALSWLLTLFSHDIASLSAVSRVFDYLLARNPAAVAYLGAAVLMRKRDRAMELEQTIEDDPGVLHSYLSSMPTLVDDEDVGVSKQDNNVKPESGTYYPTTDDSILSGGTSANTERIALPALFAQADDLWTRHSPWSSGIRVWELLGECSVVYTCARGSEADDPSGEDRKGRQRPEIPSTHVWTLTEAREWVATCSTGDAGGIDEDAIVNRRPTDSDVEDEDSPPSYPPVKRIRRRGLDPLSLFTRHRLLGLARLVRAHRSALVILLVGVGWAWYLRSQSSKQTSSSSLGLLRLAGDKNVAWWQPRSLVWPFASSVPQVTWSDVISRITRSREL